MKENLIDFIGTFVVLATTKPFVASENFVINTSEKAKVKIAYLEDTFKKENFLDKIEKPFYGSTLRHGILKKDSLDSSIIAELGGEVKAETTLAEFWATLRKQPHGEKGILSIDDWNIFYIRDNKKVLWAMNCYWDREGWRVEANSIDNLWWKTYGTNTYLEWKADNRFFFRNL